MNNDWMKKYIFFMVCLYIGILVAISKILEHV